MYPIRPTAPTGGGKADGTQPEAEAKPMVERRSPNNALEHFTIESRRGVRSVGQAVDSRPRRRTLKLYYTFMPKAALKDGRAHVRVSNAGQVSIPKPFRDAMGLEQGTVLEIEQVEGQLILTPKVLSDWEGRRAYADAKAQQQKGRLKGPLDAEGADSYLASLSKKPPVPRAKR